MTLTGRKMTARRIYVRDDDPRSYRYACPMCQSEPGERCTTLVIETLRKPMFLVHHARTDLVEG